MTAGISSATVPGTGGREAMPSAKKSLGCWSFTFAW